MERLVSLSHEETRSLLVKYFSKVIDLRIEFRKQDIAFSDLEVSVRAFKGFWWSYSGSLKESWMSVGLEDVVFLFLLC